MRSISVFILSLFSILSLHAHVGHDHSPGRKDAPQGGIVKESPSYHFELVSRNKDIMIYVYDIDMKPIEDLKKISYKASAQLPRQDKTDVAFEIMGNHFHGKFDKGAAHRYTFFLNVVDGEKNVDLKWVID